MEKMEVDDSVVDLSVRLLFSYLSNLYFQNNNFLNTTLTFNDRYYNVKFNLLTSFNNLIKYINNLKINITYIKQNVIC